MSVVHPRAYVAPGVTIGAGTVILAGAIVQPDTIIGRHTILNTACSVDHDSVVGDFTHIAPGARLAGGVRIGARSLIGLGAVLLPGRTVGSESIVGAGSVVVRDVADRTVVKGVPAREVSLESTPSSATNSAVEAPVCFRFHGLCLDMKGPDNLRKGVGRAGGDTRGA